MQYLSSIVFYTRRHMQQLFALSFNQLRNTHLLLYIQVTTTATYTSRTCSWTSICPITMLCTSSTTWLNYIQEYTGDNTTVWVSGLVVYTYFYENTYCYTTPKHSSINTYFQQFIPRNLHLKHQHFKVLTFK